MDWVQKLARSLGYVIIIQRSKKNTSGFVNEVYLICDRGGEHKVSATSKRSGSKKTNDKFQLVGKYSKEYGYWTLTVIYEKHNHLPAQHLEGHPYARRLSDSETRLVADLTAQNMDPRDILLALKELNADNVSIIKTVYNARHKIRMSQQAGKTPMQVLMSLLHINNYVFEISTNDSNELENLFFIHPTSFDIWRVFPHVLIIDCKYKTNKYNMPFLQIVGVTSTSKTFCIAFAFMHNEREASYTWVLNCLKLTLDNCMHPRVIVTDRELALMNACTQVFPEATRLLCRWHIGENIKKNCSRSFKSIHDWDSFWSMWKLLQESPTSTLYLKNYNKLQSMLIKHPKVSKYLDDVWLKTHKEMFVSTWIDQHLNFKNRTTNRVESQHAKLKKHLRSAKATFDKFVRCIDRIVQSQVIAIRESFEKSLIFRYNDHNLPLFQLLRGFVSNEALDLMLRELQRTHELHSNSSNCGCQVRNSCGLPCACELSVYLNSDIFWRKFDISPATYAQEDDIYCDDQVEYFKEEFKKQTRPVKKSWVRKLTDIVTGNSTNIKEPVVQKNTRGRPKLKKQQQKKQVDPISQDARRHSYSTTSYFVGSDFNMEPTRHSSYVIDLNEKPTSDIDMNEEPTGDINLNQELSEYMDMNSRNTRSYSNVSSVFESYVNREPTKHGSYVNLMHYSHPLLIDIFPTMYRPYITHVQHVVGDGNCEFRSVAFNRGLHQNDYQIIQMDLMDEVLAHMAEYANMFEDDFPRVYNSLHLPYEGDASFAKWMIMQDTGFLIASKYGVVAHFLSNGNVCTLLPLRSSPYESQPNIIWVIAHIHGNHFITVQLEGQYPVPVIHPQWFRSRYQCACKWENLFNA